MRFGIRQPVTRKGDRRFLTGQWRCVADIDLVRQTHAVFVLSPHDHARIRPVDKPAAEQLAGVYAVLTGEEWTADGLGTLDPEFMAEDVGGPKGFRAELPPLARDRVRYVGERVAVVIAATEALARNAAELVSVDYEVLPSVVSAVDTVRPGAPLIHEGAANNTSFTMVSRPTPHSPPPQSVWHCGPRPLHCSRRSSHGPRRPWKNCRQVSAGHHVPLYHHLCGESCKSLPAEAVRSPVPGAISC